MAPTSGQRKAAEDLKAEGNTLFSKGRYLPAAERYTEAITLVPADPAFAVLYVNRAMCYKKAGSRWQAVVQDAAKALSFNGGLLKAHYLMGVAQRELQQLPEAIHHLTKALEAAREQGDGIKDEIWRELARAKYAAWQHANKQRTAAAAVLKQHLDCLLSSQHWPPACMPPDLYSVLSGAAAAANGGSGSSSSPDNSLQDASGKLQQVLQEQWQALFERAGHLDRCTEVPSHLLCPLTMEVFREPVLTTSGFSYERSALLEHLAKVGKFDPISRAPMTDADITTNVGLRNAVHHYLDEHPWAWSECM